MKNRLARHLTELERSQKIILWDKNKILSGRDVPKEMEKTLAEAGIVLFLISADSMSDDEIMEKEVAQAWANPNCRFIPILARPYHVSESAFKDMKTLPADGKPISAWGPRPDEPCKKIAEAIAILTDTINRHKAENRRQPGRISSDFEEIEAIFKQMRDEQVMNHPDSTGYNGPLCFLHFSTYAKMLGEIRQRMLDREYNFYEGNIEDAVAVANLCRRLQERGNLLKTDHISLGVLCEEMNRATKEFRLDFATTEHAKPDKMLLAKTQYVQPFCDKIREFEKILHTLSEGSIYIDLSGLSPN